MLGKRIWKNGEINGDDYAEFKSVFGFDGGNLTLFITADTEYAVFLNGKFVYAGQYADFPWYKVRDEIDLTAFAKKGENELNIQVWYQGDENFCHYVASPYLAFSVVRDGKTLDKSDENTLSRSLPVFVSGLKKNITSQIGYSFKADFSRGEEEFTPSKVVGPSPETVKRPIKRLDVLPEKRAEYIGNGIYDLGEETVGFPFLEFEAEEGKAITVSFGERLENGRVPRIIGDRDFSFSLVGNGKRVRFCNYLRKFGLRYFEVENAKILKIGLIPVVYPFKEKKLSFGSPLRDRIYSVAKKTLLLNAFEHYTDCPWREQGFYALDSRLQMLYGYSAFENAEYQRGALALMSEDRNATGLISIVVPSSSKLVIPSFSLFYIIAMEEYAANTGDNRLIEDYFGKIESVADVFFKRIENGLIPLFTGENSWNFYEWNEGLSNEGFFNKEPLKEKFDAVLNLNAAMAFRSLSKICERLNKTEKGKTYAETAEKLNGRENEEFYDEKSGIYKATKGDGKFYELVNAYAVLSGAAKGGRARKICEKLADKRNGAVECTLSMLSFKYDALLKTDREKYAGYVLSDMDGKFGYMLSEGATSFWETIKGGADFDGAGSLCHGWSALPAYYYPLLLGK